MANVFAETFAASRPRSYSTDDDYADVERLLAELANTPRGSAQYDSKRDEIITRCLPLADHIAYRFVGRGEPSEDLLQVARLGLVKVVNRFEPGRARFLAFAVPTIFGEVRRYFRDNTWGMRVPRRVKDTHLRVRAAIEPLSQRLGRAPTPSELAAELGVDCEEVAESLDAASAYRPMSLDATLPGSRDADVTALSLQGTDDPAYGLVEDCVAVAGLLTQVSEQEREILRMRFCEGMTQTQIAQRLGKSQVHVSRLLAATLDRLRRRLWAEAPVPVTTG